MPLAVVGGSPKLTVSRAKPAGKSTVSSPAPKRMVATRPVQATKPAHGGRSVPVRTLLATTGPEKTLKTAGVSRKEPPKGRVIVPKIASWSRTSPPPKSVVINSAKKLPAEKPAARRPDRLPVVEHSLSEYINISYPPREKNRQPARAEKTPVRPEHSTRKKPVVPAVEPEEIPGVTDEQESAVAAAAVHRLH